MTVDSMKDYAISINAQSIIFTKGDQKKEMKYTPVINSDGTVLLDTNQKDFTLGKDDKGLYILGEEYIKIGNEKKLSTKFRLYLKAAK